MRTVVFALVTLALGCGDNFRPSLVIVTTVASDTLAAGDPVGARCTIVDSEGHAALDAKGNSLTDETDLVVDYEAPESFATDASGNIVAAKVGTATVRCGAPSLALVDRDPPTIEIVAGPPVRAITRLDQPTEIAGQPDGVTCLVFDAYDNAVAGFAQTLAISPSGAGTSSTASAVTATLAGEYAVTCVVAGAADVVPADLVVIPALPATLTGVLDPARTLYAILDQVTVIASAFDAFGNRVDDVAFAYASSPTVASPGPARFQFGQDGTFLLSADVTSATQNGMPLSVSLPALVDSNGPAINCMRIDAPSVAAQAYMVQQAPATVGFPVQIGAAFAVQSVTIGGNAASFDAGTGNYIASVPIGFGMNFVDVIATDQNGVQNSTTCFVLAAASYEPETTPMPGAIALRLDPYAIGDPDPSGLDSLNDLFYTVITSSALRSLVNTALVADNPIQQRRLRRVRVRPERHVQRRLDRLGPAVDLAEPGRRWPASDGVPAQRAAQRQRVRHDVLHRRLDDPGHGDLHQRDRQFQPEPAGRPRAHRGRGHAAGDRRHRHAERLRVLRIRRQPDPELLHRHRQERRAELARRASSTTTSGRCSTRSRRASTSRRSRSRSWSRGSTTPATVSARLRPRLLVARHHDDPRADRHRHAVHAGHDRAEPPEPRHRAAVGERAARSTRHEQHQPGRRLGVRRAAQPGAARAVARRLLPGDAEPRRRHRGDRQLAATGRRDRREQHGAARCSAACRRR